METDVKHFLLFFKCDFHGIFVEDFVDFQWIFMGCSWDFSGNAQTNDSHRLESPS